MNANKAVLLEALKLEFPNPVISRKNVLAVSNRLGAPFPAWLLNNANYRVERGVVDISRVSDGGRGGRVVSAPVPIVAAPAVNVVEMAPVNQVMLRQPKLVTEINSSLVPPRDGTYVPFGFHKDLEKIVISTSFYPVFITGLSGNGKTTMVEQICAKLGREAVRVNVTIETDEDDLIGGNTLVDGNVVYREGPVILAMRRGAILILDECDRGSNKLMCLQGILEGKPYFCKKTGETVFAQSGFNIIATANTKGRGSDDGKYMSAQILDDAFLERFAVTIEQEYPNSRTEKKIVLKKMHRADCVDEEFADNLVAWAEIIRKTFKDGAIDELISTRRLEHIVNAFAMFGNRAKAITLCINRFDEETKLSFLDLYTKIDQKVSPYTDQDGATGDVTGDAEEVYGAF